jgi:hypothetical protein
MPNGPYIRYCGRNKVINSMRRNIANEANLQIGTQDCTKNMTRKELKNACVGAAQHPKGELR